MLGEFRLSFEDGKAKEDKGEEREEM